MALYFIITVMNSILLKTTVILGRIIKEHREMQNLSQGEIARTAGISPSMLSQIERGLTSPSIETLIAVCDALRLDPSRLFAQLRTRQEVTHLREGERQILQQNGVLYESLAFSPDPCKPVENFLLTVPPGKSLGNNGSSHDGVESAYVLDGTAVLYAGDEVYVLSPGDSVIFRASLSHRLENNGTVPFRALMTMTPGRQW